MSQQQIKIIIIGAGPVGIRAARLLLGQNPHHEILIFGDELSTPYNRVQLSLFLMGEVSGDSLHTPIVDEEDVRLSQVYGRKIVSINRSLQIVTDDQNRQYTYDKLIIATGSRAFVPNITGNHREGVFTFRTIADAHALIDRRDQGRSVYVVGAGPLGIETALGMKSRENRVHLQVRNYLLDKSIDAKAREVLSDSINTVGISIVNNENIEEVLGENHVIGVRLTSGRVVECDTLVYCTGVIANAELAKQCGLEVNRGILVNDVMQTSDPQIYAVGECAEHKGSTYGLVAPGFEQVSSLVTHMEGKPQPYVGSRSNIQLKFGTQASAIIGDVNKLNSQSFYYVNRLKGIYRKIVVKNSEIIGFIHVGPWPELTRLQNEISSPSRLKLKAIEHFEETGLIWDSPTTVHIKNQPPEYIVCLCENVTRGALSSAMESGNRTMESLCGATRAGVTCGSCKPLLAEMLDAPAPNLVMRHHKSIYWFSIISIVLMLATVIFEPFSISDTAQVQWQLEKLWFDNSWKQFSGYTLLALSLMAGGISIRKRWKKLNIGHLDDWRYVHSIIGVSALIILLIHTGMRLGNNLNLALMTIFLTATLTGSLVGVFMARNHHWTDLKLRQHRTWWSRVHYSLLWMLPALLTYHIISVYYF